MKNTVWLKIFMFMFLIIPFLSHAGSCKKPSRSSDWGACSDNFKKAEDFCDSKNAQYNLSECDKCCGYFENVSCGKPSECKILKNPPKTTVSIPIVNDSNAVENTSSGEVRQEIQLEKQKIEEDQRRQEELKKIEEEKRLQGEKNIAAKQKIENIKVEIDNLIKEQDSAILFVESRSEIKRFFLGEDYKNIGQLRSALVKNDAQIRKLQLLLQESQFEEITVVVQQELEQLLNQQSKMSETIERNKSTFSLLGWFMKILSN